MPIAATTRFAPSPTGYLHLGHAFSAWLNHDAARSCQGRFILRMEDIDQTRCRTTYEEAILNDLYWLGLVPDGPVWKQSERLAIYSAALDRLAEEGLIYRCFKTRAELSELMAAPHGTTKAEPATSPLPPLEEKRRLADGQPFAWRLHAARARQHLGQDTLDWREMDSGGIVHGHQSDLLDLTDVVLARKETPTSYHLASVIDDGEQGVDLVWRGEDLRSAVPIHRVLQELLGITAPVYRHHRLITNDKGQRLAKRDQAETLQVMRMSGVTPSQIRQRLGLDVRTS